MRTILAVLFWIPLTLPFCACRSDDGASSGVHAPPGGDDPTAELNAVALYDDHGCWQESVLALERLLRWMDLGVTRVDARSIRERGLAGFSILCVPGGDMYRYSRDLGSDGIGRIREFVASGGGYIGICGGAYFAGSSCVWRGRALPIEPLRLYEGTAEGPWDALAAYPGYGLCALWVTDPSHPITRDLTGSFQVLYYWGPSLSPRAGSSVSILARYESIDQPAMLAFDYGRGRVFLVGTHPEIEENDARDGHDFASELADPDSEWDLLRNAVHWCRGR